ncbi:integrase core domain-containing protein [Bradyrhizobium jicamae]|uniref:integrase core domain-containing protein n=1 Tax=Bradyrhizobium jicamae TaxID=280332 RepID=UPI0012EE24F9
MMRIDNWMEDYNSEHPHSRLGYRSPREYLASIKPAEFRSNGNSTGLACSPACLRAICSDSFISGDGVMSQTFVLPIPTDTNKNTNKVGDWTRNENKQANRNVRENPIFQGPLSMSRTP